MESAEEPSVQIPEVSYPLTDTPETFSLWYSFPGDLSDIMDALFKRRSEQCIKGRCR